MMLSIAAARRGDMEYWLPLSNEKAKVGNPDRVADALLYQVEHNALDPVEAKMAWSLVVNANGIFHPISFTKTYYKKYKY